MKHVNAINAVIRDGDRILLMFSNTHETWHLPGGKIDAGEEKFDALRREVREELGIECEPTELLCVTHDENKERIFHCENWLVDWDGTPTNKEPEKTDEIGWFSVGVFPSVLSHTARDVLRALEK